MIQSKLVHMDLYNKRISKQLFYVNENQTLIIHYNFKVSLSLLTELNGVAFFERPQWGGVSLCGLFLSPLLFLHVVVYLLMFIYSLTNRCG